MFVITGASGFLGSAVANVLAGRGQPVLAVSRNPVSIFGSIKRRQVETYDDLVPPASDSVLIHLAEPNVISSAESKGSVHEARMRGALAALLAKGWSHVVYASSAAVYGDQFVHPRDISDSVAPASAYARAKLECENDVRERSGSVARLSNLYGPGMAKNSVIAEMLAQIPGQGDLKVRTVAPVRDYLWIEDGARGIADLAMQRAGGLLNFGSGRGISVGDLGRMLLTLAGENRSIAAAAPSVQFSHLVLDIGRTAAELGWKPEVSLEAGLKSLLAAPR